VEVLWPSLPVSFCLFLLLSVFSGCTVKEKTKTRLSTRTGSTARPDPKFLPLTCCVQNDTTIACRSSYPPQAVPTNPPLPFCSGFGYDIVAELAEEGGERGADQTKAGPGEKDGKKAFFEFVRFARHNVRILSSFPFITLQQAANFPNRTAPQVGVGEGGGNEAVVELVAVHES
jgi:hypothetical protein